MFTQVLVAIDGSPTGNRGLKAAIGLATDQKAALSIVHVIDSMAGVSYVGDIGYVPAGYIDTMLDDLRTHGRKILAKAEAVARESGVDVKTLLTESKGGSIADAILGAARKVRADVIVLGTHGRRGLSRVLMGSDAEAVLREARIPVMLVRSPESSASMRPAKAASTPRASRTGAGETTKGRGRSAKSAT
jgi:nucleotide-binding universal stress UspA family protein